MDQSTSNLWSAYCLTIWSGASHTESYLISTVAASTFLQPVSLRAPLLLPWAHPQHVPNLFSLLPPKTLQLLLSSASTISPYKQAQVIPKLNETQPFFLCPSKCTVLPSPPEDTW